MAGSASSSSTGSLSTQAARGVGFITTPANVVVKAYTPEGIGLGIRRALI